MTCRHGRIAKPVDPAIVPGLAPGAPAPAAAEVPVLEVPVEQWVYDRGPGRLLAIVTLRGGRIEAVEDGRRR